MQYACLRDQTAYRIIVSKLLKNDLKIILQFCDQHETLMISYCSVILRGWASRIRNAIPENYVISTYSSVSSGSVDETQTDFIHSCSSVRLPNEF